MKRLLLLVALTAGLLNAGIVRSAEVTTTADAKVTAIVGELTDTATWRAYLARFVSSTGRVIDTADGDISHSEGQGYGMLLAVAANDRAAFERIWGWTRANLAVRDDRFVGMALGTRPAAGGRRHEQCLGRRHPRRLGPYGSRGRMGRRRLPRGQHGGIAVELGRKLVLPRTIHGPILLPGLAGFAAEDRPDGPVVNLSYWVFPALARLPMVAPEFDWKGLSRNGVTLVRQSQLGPAHLPSEWTSLAAPDARAADGFQARFAHNAIRIPLYLAWAGLTDGVTPFGALWDKRDERGIPVVDTATGRPVEWLGEAGYGAIAALTECAERGRTMPAMFRTVHVANDQYYSVTLHLLTLVAAHMRYPQCLRS